MQFKTFAVVVFFLVACGDPAPKPFAHFPNESGSSAGSGEYAKGDASDGLEGDATIEDAMLVEIDASADADADAGMTLPDAGNRCSQYRWWSKGIPAECDQLLWSHELSETMAAPDTTDTGSLCWTTSLTSGPSSDQWNQSVGQSITLLAGHKFCSNDVEGQEVFLPVYTPRGADFFDAIAVQNGSLKVVAEARPFYMPMPNEAPLFALSSIFKWIDVTDRTVLRIVVTGSAGYSDPATIAVKMRWEIRGY